MPVTVTVTVDEAQARLRELIENLAPGEEVVITLNQQPVARLVPVASLPRKPRQPGTLRGTVLHMAADFDAPLEDFKEYLG
jgi:prevent-host-death family protein